jgi:hypothetical protein
VLGDGKTAVAIDESIKLEVELFSHVTNEIIKTKIDFLVFNTGMEVLINLDTLYLKLNNFFPDIVKKTQDEIKVTESKYQQQVLINSRNAGDDFDYDSLDEEKQKEDVIMDEINLRYSNRCDIPTTFDDSFNLNNELSVGDVVNYNREYGIVNEDLDDYLYEIIDDNVNTSMEEYRFINSSSQTIAKDLYKSKIDKIMRDPTRPRTKDRLLKEVEEEQHQM